MTTEVETCRPYDSLAVAARIMWDRDCGCVPVLDDAGRPIAMVTDRDVCMAAYTQGRRLEEIPVSIAMSCDLVACGADDPISRAEQLMNERQLRRLPVLDGQGTLVGLLSLNDLVRFHDPHGARAVRPDALVHTLAAIGERRLGTTEPALVDTSSSAQVMAAAQ